MWSDRNRRGFDSPLAQFLSISPPRHPSLHSWPIVASLPRTLCTSLPSSSERRGSNMTSGSSTSSPWCVKGGGRAGVLQGTQRRRPDRRSFPCCPSSPHSFRSTTTMHCRCRLCCCWCCCRGSCGCCPPTPACTTLSSRWGGSCGRGRGRSPLLHNPRAWPHLVTGLSCLASPPLQASDASHDPPPLYSPCARWWQCWVV